jgi:hypothetical protein
MTKFLLALLTAGIVLVDGGRSATEGDTLRSFAFSICLSEAYKGTPFAADAERVAEFYREVGRTSRPDVYQRLMDMARQGNPGQPAAVDGRNLGIMRCLELYESKALKDLVKTSRTSR